MKSLLWPVIVSAIFTASWADPAWSARHALVIGIDDYEHIPDLQKARNDATAIAATLEDVGFSVTVGLDLDERAFNRSLVRFENQIEAGDEVVFHYSGHGIRVEGRNWLLPADVPRVAVNEQSLLISESIAADSVLDRFRRKGARVTVMILDACRDNPFPTDGARSVGGSERGLTSMASPPRGSFVLFSADASQTALDRLSGHDPSPYSVYTRNLLPLLKEPNLSIRELAHRVRRGVQQTAGQVGHPQFPAYYDALENDFFFNDTQATQAHDLAAERQGEAASAADIDGNRAEIVFWQSISNSDRSADFAAYLSRFGEDGIFSELAALRLSEFRDDTRIAARPGPKAATPEEVERALGIGLSEWRNIQRALNGLDLNVGEPDGLPGRRTRAGIAAWQRSEGLQPTGYLVERQKTALLALSRTFDQPVADPLPEPPVAQETETTGPAPTREMLREWYVLGDAADAQAQYDQAHQWYLKAADFGYAPAQHRLGHLYKRGRGVPQDYAEAIRWMRLATDQGYEWAQNNLGSMYEYGLGVEQDDAEAARWYRKSADQGNDNGQNYLGRMYELGRGVPQDLVEAARLYRLSAEQDEPWAQYNLARLYEDGRGVEQDLAEATRLYRQAAAAGHEDSQAWLVAQN